LALAVGGSAMAMEVAVIGSGGGSYWQWLWPLAAIHDSGGDATKLS